MLTRDEKMITAPDTWPAYPLLPLRHRRRPLFKADKLDDEDAIGFLVAAPTPPFTVYVGCMFFAATLERLRREKYDTVDALLADWQVD